MSVVPLDRFLAGDMTRVLVLRHPDSALAARAAGLVQEAASHAAARGRQIPYDFRLRDEDATQLYCAELVAHAFGIAAGGAMHTPRFRSTMHRLKPEFRGRLGIRTTRAFLPGDLEVDPQFELVAEWRDLRRTRENRRLDLDMTPVMEWMWRLDYFLRGTASSFIGEWIVYPLRHTPVLGRPLKRRMARNVPRELLGTILRLCDLVHELAGVAEELDAAGVVRTGYPLSQGEMVAALENFRLEDLARYRAHRECRDHGRAGGRATASRAHATHPGSICISGRRIRSKHRQGNANGRPAEREAQRAGRYPFFSGPTSISSFV